jgi:hypothetical protein
MTTFYDANIASDFLRKTVLKHSKDPCVSQPDGHAYVHQQCEIHDEGKGLMNNVPIVEQGMRMVPQQYAPVQQGLLLHKLDYVFSLLFDHGCILSYQML